MMNEIKRQGNMFIFSSPSGGGKSSVIKELMKEIDGIQMSISVTTRKPREGEVDGKDYYFVSEEKFKEMLDNNDLYEYVNSDFGPKYGTPRNTVDEILGRGEDVILDLDYPGVQQLRKLAGDKVKTIAILPPSLQILYERLVNRGTDSKEVIERRMSMAEKRIKECVHYDYVVINDVLDDAVSQVKDIILAARVERKNLSNINELIEQVIRG